MNARTNEHRVIVHADRDELVIAVARRFCSKVRELIEKQPFVHVTLTGGTVGIAVLAEIAEQTAQSPLDWSRVHLWWGDERWVARDSDERNERQARDALIGRIDIPESNVHAFPASNEGLTLEDGANTYSRQLEEYATREAQHPRFDITFLGVGPDGHIASLFPERSEIRVTDRAVVAVRDSPKPPPERLSLTRYVLNSSERIWLVLAGSDKASALGLALAGASYDEVPAAGAKGRKRTVFFVDAAAASEVPRDLIDPDY